MKTLRSSLTALTATVLALCGNPELSEAHGDISVRSNCGYFARKFRTEATVKKCGSFYKTEDEHKSCGNSESWVETYACSYNTNARTGNRMGPAKPYTVPSPFIPAHGRARAKCGYNGNMTESYAESGTKTFRDIYRNFYVGDICAGNAENKDVRTTIIRPLYASGDYYRRSGFESDDIVIDETTRTVTIINFRAVLRNHPESYSKEHSAVALSLTNTPDDASDSLALNDDAYYQSTVLLESRIMLKNGNLMVDGLFNNMDIQVKDSSGVQVAYIKAEKYVFEVEGDVDMSKLALHIGSDVGTTDYTISTRFNPGANATVYNASNFANSSSVTTFSAYPNPISGNALTVQMELNRAQNVTVELLNQQGVVLRSIYTGILTANARRNFQVNAQGLAPGTYYLRMRLASGVLTRRIVK